MKTRPKLNAITIIISIVLLMACATSNARSFLGYTYENNVPSIRFAIGQTLSDGGTPLAALGILDEWIKHIEETKNIVPTDAEKDKLLALCYRHKADAYQELESINLSIENYTKSLELDSTEINTYFNRAALYANKTDEYDKAIKDFEDILIKRPDFGDAYFAIGKIYDKQGKYVEAINYYNKAIATNNERQDYKDNKTVAYMALHKSENASEEASTLIEANTQDVEAYELSGNTHYMKGEYEEAIKDYTQAINLDPQPGYYSLRANSYATLGKYKEAIADFSEAIDLLGDNSGLMYSMRAKAYLAVNDRKKALADYNKGVELASYSPVPYTMRGDYYMELGVYEKVIADYTKAINIYPYPDYYRKRAEAYEKLEKKALAKEDFDKAEEMESDTTEYEQKE